MGCETEERIPPMGWYEGIAFPREGIRMVLPGTDTFFALHWDLCNKWDTWVQTQLTPRQTEFPSPEIARLHKEAGDFIHTVTGFAPEVLMDYKRKLDRMYTGQSMGPFPFPVTWIEK